MKKILFLAMSVVLIFSLVGCKSTSISDESIGKMELEMQNKNYEKAVSYIDIALDDEKLKDREELLKLKRILEDYLLALEYYEQGDFDLSKSILDNIDGSYDKYSIKEDIDKLRLDISEKIKEISKLEKIDDFKRLVEDDEVVEARKYYKKIVKEDFTEEEREELEALGQKLIAKEEARKEKARKEEVKKEDTNKIYTGEDSWKNYNHKRPDHVNKKIEENKKRSKRYR